MERGNEMMQPISTAPDTAAENEWILWNSQSPKHHNIQTTLLVYRRSTLNLRLIGFQISEVDTGQQRGSVMLLAAELCDVAPDPR